MATERTEAGEPERRGAAPLKITDYPVCINMENIVEFPEFQTTAHWVDSIQMIQVREGRMSMLINGKIVVVREGDFILIPPKQIHSFFAINGESCLYVYIFFGEDIFTNNRIIIDNFINQIIFNKDIEYYHITSNANLNEIINIIYELNAKKENSYQLNIIGYLHCLLSEMYALFSHDDIPRKDESRGEMLPLLRRMMKYIYRHYDEKINIDDIASSVHISRSRCFSLFRKYAKQSPINFVNEYRLTMAQHLLRNSRDSIAEVAFSCGFSHQSYFTELFTRKFGCTPLQYRKGRCGADAINSSGAFTDSLS